MALALISKDSLGVTDEEPVELGALLTSEQTLDLPTYLAAIDAGLAYSARPVCWWEGHAEQRRHCMKVPPAGTAPQPQLSTAP